MQTIGFNSLPSPAKKVIKFDVHVLLNKRQFQVED